MAIVVSIGERRNKQQAANSSSLTEKWFEKPLYDAEMHKVRMFRADHPSKSNESVIFILFIWAALNIGFCSYWFVKYIIN